MKRKIAFQLEQADEKGGKRSVVIYGMKCTGKTYAVLDHVRNHYEEYLYIDAAHDKIFTEYMKQSIDKEPEPSLFADYFGISREYMVNIPVILDEPDIEVINALVLSGDMKRQKLFIIVSDEERVRVIAEKIKEEPVFIKISPMNFGEFLTAVDKEWYDEVITGHLMSKRKLPDMIHEELNDLYDIYCQTGGMPEIVDEYLRSGTLENIKERQENLNNSLRYYVMKKAEAEKERADRCTGLQDYGVSANKVLGLMEAVEHNLDKENHKFMFSVIRDGVSRKNYEGSIRFLCDEGILNKVSKLSEDKKTGGQDFRLYFSDVSLYECREGNKIMESIVIQNILSSGLKTYYWESGKGASLDCVIDIKGVMVPADIYTKGKGKGRSVKSFLEKEEGGASIRLSDENCSFDDKQVRLPIYASYAIDKITF